MTDTDLAVTGSTAISLGHDDDFTGMGNRSFLPALRFFSKGSDDGTIKPGNYGIPISEDRIVDLGDSVDIVPLARRMKALDKSDPDDIVVSYLRSSPDFKRIIENADDSGGDLMWGCSFLVYERTSKKILELWFGTKSSRSEAEHIYPFLPADENEAQPCTLKSRKPKNAKHSYRIPLVSVCSTPIDLPSDDLIAAAVQKFLNPQPPDKAETAPEGQPRAR
jgi:hypothetical protein